MYYYALLLSLGIIFLLPFVSYLFAGLTILLLFALIKAEWRFPILIAAFLLVTSDISEELRLAVNFGGYFILFVFFFRKYGFEIKRYPVIPTNILYLVFFTILSMLISGFLSEDRILTFTYLLKQFLFFVLIYFFYAAMCNYKNIKDYIFALIMTGVVLGSFIIYYFLTSDISVYIFELTGYVSEGGYVNNVAAAGGLFIVSISLNFILIFSDSENMIKFKPLLITILIIQILSLILTNSRAALLGTFISLIWISIRLRSRVMLKIGVLLTIGIIVFVLTNQNLINTFENYIRAERIFNNPRTNLWTISWSIIDDYPFFGVGPGMFKNYMFTYLPISLNSWSMKDIYFIYEYASVGHAHNFFLFRFTELGIPGLLTGIYLLFIFFKLSFKTMKTYALIDRNTYLFIVGVIGCGLGLIGRSVFESTGLLSYGWITRDLPFWLLLAIVVYLNNNKNSFSKMFT